MVPGSRMVPDPSRSVRRQSRQSDLGGFAEPVLWYVRAKRTSGWATAAYRAQSLLWLGRGGFRRLLLHAIMVLAKPTIKAVIESYAYLANLVGNKNITIVRLRKMLFGASTEKTAAVTGSKPESEPPSSPDVVARAESLQEAHAGR